MNPTFWYQSKSISIGNINLIALLLWPLCISAILDVRSRILQSLDHDLIKILVASSKCKGVPLQTSRSPAGRV